MPDADAPRRLSAHAARSRRAVLRHLFTRLLLETLFHADMLFMYASIDAIFDIFGMLPCHLPGRPPLCRAHAWRSDSA